MPSAPLVYHFAFDVAAFRKQLRLQTPATVASTPQSINRPSASPKKVTHHESLAHDHAKVRFSTPPHQKGLTETSQPHIRSLSPRVPSADKRSSVSPKPRPAQQVDAGSPELVVTVAEPVGSAMSRLRTEALDDVAQHKRLASLEAAGIELNAAPTDAPPPRWLVLHHMAEHIHQRRSEAVELHEREEADREKAQLDSIRSEQRRLRWQLHSNAAKVAAAHSIQADHDDGFAISLAPAVVETTGHLVHDHDEHEDDCGFEHRGGSGAMRSSEPTSNTQHRPASSVHPDRIDSGGNSASMSLPLGGSKRYIDPEVRALWEAKQQAPPILVPLRHSTSKLAATGTTKSSLEGSASSQTSSKQPPPPPVVPKREHTKVPSHTGLELHATSSSRSIAQHRDADEEPEPNVSGPPCEPSPRRPSVNNDDFLDSVSTRFRPDSEADDSAAYGITAPLPRIVDDDAQEWIGQGGDDDIVPPPPPSPPPPQRHEATIAFDNVPTRAPLSSAVLLRHNVMDRSRSSHEVEAATDGDIVSDPTASPDDHEDYGYAPMHQNVTAPPTPDHSHAADVVGAQPLPEIDDPPSSYRAPAMIKPAPSIVSHASRSHHHDSHHLVSSNPILVRKIAVPAQRPFSDQPASFGPTTSQWRDSRGHYEVDHFSFSKSQGYAPDTDDGSLLLRYDSRAVTSSTDDCVEALAHYGE